MANIIGRTAECFLIHKLLIENFDSFWYSLGLFINEELLCKIRFISNPRNV